MLPSGATMVVGAAPKVGTVLTSERFSELFRSLSGHDREVRELRSWLRATAASYFAAKRALHAAYRRIEGLEGENRRVRGELHVAENNANRHAEDSMVLQGRNKELSGRLEEAEAVLKAYADPNNWYEDSLEGDGWVRKYGERGWEPAQHALGKEKA